MEAAAIRPAVKSPGFDKLSGQGQFRGAFVGKSLDMKQSSRVSYDEALRGAAR